MSLQLLLPFSLFVIHLFLLMLLLLLDRGGEKKIEKIEKIAPTSSPPSYFCFP